EIVEDALAVGVEDVRSVGMDQHAVRIEGVVRVAADVRTLVEDQHAQAALRQPLGHHGAGEAGSHHHHVQFLAASLLASPHAAILAGWRMASSMCWRILPTMASQDELPASWMPSSMALPRGASIADPTALMNSSGEAATSTIGTKCR